MGYSPWGCKEMDMIEQLSIERISILFSTVGVLIYIGTNRACVGWEEGSLLPTPSPAFIICRFLCDDLSDQCDMRYF